jgi:ABC-type polysaccharide/polyol phosphate transport system ATPase subunit
VIYLRNVSKYHLDAQLGHEVVLRDVSLGLPTDRPLAIVGSDARLISTILLMLTGAKAPDRGEIARGRIRCSPVINLGGGGAATFLGQLSALDNISSLAAMYGVDRRKLIALVESAGSFASRLDMPFRKLEWASRRSIEAATIAALPFDCYFIDRLHMLDIVLVRRMFHAARLRGAGVIFSTDRVPQALRLAKVGALASNGRLQLAENLQETLASHGQAGKNIAASV